MMLPGITPALSGSASRGNDQFTKLLLHFDGANGATSGPGFVDASPTAKGSATNFGLSSISTAQSKFGGSSFVNGQNGYCTMPSHADYDFGAGDFTIDWWEYRSNFGCVLARDLTTTFCPFLCGFYPSGSNPLFYATSTGSSWDLANAQIMGDNVNLQWNHFAVSRSGNTWRTFKNGVVQSTWTAAGAIITNSNPLCIGAAQSGQNFGGYTDELRISKGIARWTANFTPPTLPYS